MIDRCNFSDSESNCVLERGHNSSCQSMPKVGHLYIGTDTGREYRVESVETVVSYVPLAADEGGIGRRSVESFLNRFGRVRPHRAAKNDIYVDTMDGERVRVLFTTGNFVVYQWMQGERPHTLGRIEFAESFALVERA